MNVPQNQHKGEKLKLVWKVGWKVAVVVVVVASVVLLILFITGVFSSEEAAARVAAEKAATEKVAEEVPGTATPGTGTPGTGTPGTGTPSTGTPGTGTPSTGTPGTGTPGTGTPGTGTSSAGTPSATPNLKSNDLGSMDVREFFTPVGGATYTVGGVTTPKYTGLTFTIQGELEEGYGTAYKGYKGKGFVGINRITPRTSLRFTRYIHNTSTTQYHIGHWEVLYKGTTGASDPVVQFKAQQGTLPPRFLTTKLPDGGPEAPEAVLPFLSTTDDGTKPETHFVLQGTLLECQIIQESAQKAIRAAGEVDTVNMTQLLYADAVPGADVARSRWTLGYVQGPLGPDGTIFDRS